MQVAVIGHELHVGWSKEATSSSHTWEKGPVREETPPLGFSKRHLWAWQKNATGHWLGCDWASIGPCKNGP